MANICSFVGNLKVDSREKAEMFEKIAQQYLELSIYDECDDGTFALNGWCKWSVSSMLDRVPLLDILQQSGATLELYSEEYGIGFEEHFIFEGNKIVYEECRDATYFDYETIAEELQLEDEEVVSEEDLKEFFIRALDRNSTDYENAMGEFDTIYAQLQENDYCVVGGFHNDYK